MELPVTETAFGWSLSLSINSSCQESLLVVTVGLHAGVAFFVAVSRSPGSRIGSVVTPADFGTGFLRSGTAVDGLVTGADLSISVV